VPNKPFRTASHCAVLHQQHGDNIVRETTYGSVHGWDCSITDLFLHDMNEQELYLMSLTLHMPFRILLQRAQFARERKRATVIGLPELEYEPELPIRRLADYPC
jgi:hypothetical protein